MQGELPKGRCSECVSELGRVIRPEDRMAEAAKAETKTFIEALSPINLVEAQKHNTAFKMCIRDRHNDNGCDQSC